MGDGAAREVTYRDRSAAQNLSRRAIRQHIDRDAALSPRIAWTLQRLVPDEISSCSSASWRRRQINLVGTVGRPRNARWRTPVGVKHTGGL